MKMFYTTARVVVLSAFVLIYHVHAGEGDASGNINEQLKNALSFADTKTHGVFVIGGTLLANNPSLCAADNIALKSALETAGYAIGSCQADLSKLNYKEAGEHFVVNCLVREAGSALSAKGYSLDPLVTACDQLPEVVKNVFAPIVTQGVQVVTHPETLTIATLYMMNNVVIPYLENGTK